MNIQSKFFGEVVVDEENIITFPDGLPGFLEEQKFVLIPLNETSPFVVLQSIEKKDVGFMVTNPFQFKKDYAFDLAPEEQQALQIEKKEQVLLYAILTLKDSFTTSTMNLLAPVIINADKKIGKQIVLADNVEHPLRYPLQAEKESVRSC